MTTAVSCVLSDLQFESFRGLRVGVLSALLGSSSGGRRIGLSETVLEEAVLEEEPPVGGKQLPELPECGASVEGSVQLLDATKMAPLGSMVAVCES